MPPLSRLSLLGLLCLAPAQFLAADAGSAAADLAAPSVAPVASRVGIAATSNLIIEKRAIGRSVQGRTIWAFRKGNASAGHKVVIIGQMHGDESGGRYLARHLRDSVPVATTADVWIIPTMNPDAAAAGTRLNARRVDLNRNFPHIWRRQNAGTGTYSGPSAASEPETRAVAAFLRTVSPRYVVSIHQPLYGIDSYGVKDLGLMRRLAAELRLPIRSFACTGICRGTLTGWFNSARGGAAITVEYGRSPSKTALRRAAGGVLRATRAL